MLAKQTLNIFRILVRNKSDAQLRERARRDYHLQSGALRTAGDAVQGYSGSKRRSFVKSVSSLAPTSLHLGVPQHLPVRGSASRQVRPFATARWTKPCVKISDRYTSV